MKFKFENDVKQYGTQSLKRGLQMLMWFENDVKQYGTQASATGYKGASAFENDVKQYGTQAYHRPTGATASLRMM